MDKNEIEIRETEIRTILENNLYEDENEEKELLEELEALEKESEQQEKITMYSKRITLTNKSRTPLSLAYLFYDSFELCDAIEECKDAEGLCCTVSKYMYGNGSWIIARDDTTTTRLQYQDRLGNIYYLIANKIGNVCLKDVPDNELVMELISRGYKVSR